MDSLRYGFVNALRNTVKTMRILVNDRREYLVGIILLLVVVFLWALSNFVTQVHTATPSIPFATRNSVGLCRTFSKEDTRNRSCAVAS